MAHPGVPKTHTRAELGHYDRFAATLVKGAEYRILAAGSRDLGYHRVFSSSDPLAVAAKLAALSEGGDWEIIKLERVEMLDHNIKDLS